MSHANVRMGWLKLLGAVDTHGAEPALPFPVAALACFGARDAMPRSLASVTAAMVARFLPRAFTNLEWRQNVSMNSFGHDVLFDVDKRYFWRTTTAGRLEKFRVRDGTKKYTAAPAGCYQLAHVPEQVLAHTMWSGSHIACVSVNGVIFIMNDSMGEPFSLKLYVEAGCCGICFVGDDTFICNVDTGEIFRFSVDSWTPAKTWFATVEQPRRLCALRVDGAPCVAVTVGCPTTPRVSVFRAVDGKLLMELGKDILMDPFALVFDEATSSLLVADLDVGIVVFDVDAPYRRPVKVFKMSGAAGLSLHGNTLLVSKVARMWDHWLVGVFELR